MPKSSDKSPAVVSRQKKRTRPSPTGNKSSKLAGLPAASATRARTKRTDLVATTLRLRPELHHGLELLQESLGVTMNKLMNDGLAMFVSTKTAALESDLQAALERIQRYRRSDPTFARDFDAIVAAEVAHQAEDDIEGVAHREEEGPAVSIVRQLIADHR